VIPQTPALLACFAVLLATPAAAKDAKPADRKAEAARLEKACDALHEEPCIALSRLLSKDPGVPKEVRRAAQLYREACAGEGTIGCGDFVELLFDGGRGILSDDARAVRHYDEFFCHSGVSAGCALLADRYAEGRGVGQDLSKAAELYARACTGPRDPERDCGESSPARDPEVLAARAEPARRADRGDPEACLSLGRMHEAGTGVSRDGVLARRFFQAGCRGGLRDACERANQPTPCSQALDPNGESAWAAIVRLSNTPLCARPDGSSTVLERLPAWRGLCVTSLTVRPDPPTGHFWYEARSASGKTGWVRGANLGLLQKGSRFLYDWTLPRKDLSVGGTIYRLLLAENRADDGWAEDCVVIREGGLAVPVLHEPGSSSVLPIVVPDGTPLPKGSTYGVKEKKPTPDFRLVENEQVMEVLRNASVTKGTDGERLELVIYWSGQEEESDHGTYLVRARKSGDAFVVTEFVVTESTGSAFQEPE
jgi:hypothetical protein